MAIGAGELDVRGVVKRLKENLEQDANGQVDEATEENWRTLATRWVKLVPRGSREFFRAQQVVEDISHKVVMLFDSESQTFTTQDKLVVGKRQFHFAGPGIDDDERHETITFAAIETV